MYNVSSDYKNQINQERLHTIRGKIFPYSWDTPNFEGFDITSVLCGEISVHRQCTDNSETFGIGAVYQNELNFSLKKNMGFSADLYDARVILEFGLILESNETEWVPLGVFYISEIEKQGNILKIKALDRMSALDIPTGLMQGQTYTFEKSMKNITENTGVEFAQTFDEIENLTSVKLWQHFGTGTPETYRDILREMAQLFGGFTYINRDGMIEFKRLDNTEPVAEIPANRRHSLTISEREMRFGKIRYKTTEGYTTSYTIYGNGITVYFENNNMIMDSNQDQSGEKYVNDWVKTVLENICESLKNINYYSGTIEYSGDPALDIGDYVRITGGDSNGELMLIGSDNWVFRGVQTLIAPSEDTSISTTTKTQNGKNGKDGTNGTDGVNGTDGKDGFSPTVEVLENTENSYILKITDKNGTFETPNLKAVPNETKFLECDTALSGTVLECDFTAAENVRNLWFSGDLVIYSENCQETEIKYFLDNIELDFTPKFSVNEYSTQHLSIFFNAESGEHNFKAVLKSGMTQQVQGKIIGQGITKIDVKPTTSDDYIYITENNAVTLLYYKGTLKNIIIPSEIDGNPVTVIEATCFTNSDVKNVVIPETVEKIY